MLSIYVIMILIEYMSIKLHAWNMESEINKLKEVIENEIKESVVYREVGNFVVS